MNSKPAESISGKCRRAAPGGGMRIHFTLRGGTPASRESRQSPVYTLAVVMSSRLTVLTLFQRCYAKYNHNSSKTIVRKPSSAKINRRFIQSSGLSKSKMEIDSKKLDTSSTENALLTPSPESSPSHVDSKNSPPTTTMTNNKEEGISTDGAYESTTMSKISDSNGGGGTIEGKSTMQMTTMNKSPTNNNNDSDLSSSDGVSNNHAIETVGDESEAEVGDRVASFQQQQSMNNSFSYGSSYEGEPDATIFNQVSYLGCSTIESPKSEMEIQKVMSVLNSEKIATAIEAAVLIPATSDGTVELVETATNSVIAQFKVHRILFCARGRLETGERDCFAFSYLSGGGAPDTTVYQCHAFRCNVPEAVGKVLLCFASAFSRTPKRHPYNNSLVDGVSSGDGAGGFVDGCFAQTGGGASAGGPTSGEIDFQFDIFLEMKEEDGKGGATLAPQEKNCFKLRRGRERRIIVALQQVGGPKLLVVQKCFGLLLAAGRNVKHSDMHLLDMQSMGRGNDDRTYLIEALWDPNTPQFEVLNQETPKDTRVFMTVAADVVLSGIHEPVRFLVECKARIFHEHERFWYVTRKPVVERYFLTATRARANPENNDQQNHHHHQRGCELEVTAFESATERDRRMCRAIGRSPSKMPANLVAPQDDDESDSDEPLLSGSGEVNHEYSAEVLNDWGECLGKWRKDLSQRPKELNVLIRNGIPDALRGEVWQLLVSCYKDPEMMDTYRLLLSKACPNEQVILRDIHRTFPAHDYFKEAGGTGQDALYKLSKAYSLYDEEVGYCQGLSFLAASLLLHMPEEQAFCVLVKIMFDYGMRDLFKLGFEALHLRFYQLERLIEDYVPDLHRHFMEINVETHMFASQWFLTMFTAKFPLLMVFHIIDLFLSEGINTIFHISLALLKASKKDLLQLDFEGALKYFRVVLPRKYRTEATATELIQQAVRLKISHKRLSKYEKEYITMKQQEAESQDPLERLERENLKLKEAVMRLERENDDLAHELVTSKVQLRNRLDAAEDNIESLQAQTEKLTRLNHDMEEENKQLLMEAEQVKEMCRRELQKLEEENKRSQSIITNYKQICSDLSNRLEKQQTSFKQETKQIMKIVNQCERCRQQFAVDGSTIVTTTNGGGGQGQGGSETSSPTDESGGGDMLSSLRAQDEQIRQLELELAQTKLALVESQCRNQDLTHQLNNSTQQQQESMMLKSSTANTSGTWLSKTISSIKEATRNPSISKDSPLGISSTMPIVSTSSIVGGGGGSSAPNSMPNSARKDSGTNVGF